MTKCLVTGASGFLGRHCSIELAKLGHEVIGIDLNTFADAKDWGLIYHQANCNLPTLIHILKKNDIDTIFHCAGSGSVPASFTHPYHDFHANVVTTIEVLEFCRQNPSIRIVIPSSAAVYGNTVDLPILETSPLNPISPYGVHKKIIEDLCKSYSSNFGLQISIVRFFSLYGVGLQKQILWDACKKATEDDFIFNGFGHEKRDFLHVSDAANLMISLKEFASSTPLIVNGGTGIGTAIKDVVDMIGKSWIPPIKATFTGENRMGDPTDFIADTKLMSEINFTPSKKLTEEIPSYIDWFLREYVK